MISLVAFTVECPCLTQLGLVFLVYGKPAQLLRERTGREGRRGGGAVDYVILWLATVAVCCVSAIIASKNRILLTKQWKPERKQQKAFLS